ncbi:hypothetical protein ACLOJK_018296, partial [Asimina triloba]
NDSRALHIFDFWAKEGSKKAVQYSTPPLASIPSRRPPSFIKIPPWKFPWIPADILLMLPPGSTGSVGPGRAVEHLPELHLCLSPAAYARRPITFRPNPSHSSPPGGGPQLARAKDATSALATASASALKVRRLVGPVTSAPISSSSGMQPVVPTAFIHTQAVAVGDKLALRK